MTDAETPPPGTRPMAIVRWAVVAAMAIVAAAAIVAGVATSRHDPAGGGQAYYCPMHPQIVQDQAGECPICKMTLVPKPVGPVVPSTTMAPAVAGPGKYHCPMHPEVTSDDPAATCPKCGGMRLVPRPTVPALVPITLAPDRVQLIGVRTAKATRAPLATSTRTVGVVAANERGFAQVNTRFSGYIETLLVSETGQRVRQGQTLATVYSPDVLRVEQELLTARGWRGQGASADHPHLTQGLEGDARRRLQLLGVGGDEIERVIRTGKPSAATAVRSPVDGYVITKNAVLGAAVQPGVPLFEIADLRTVWVQADVYEGDVGRLRVGQSAAFELGAWPGETFAGKVQFVSPTVDPATRTLRARIEVKNRPGPAGPKLRPGMHGQVMIALGAREALAVPAEAVIDTGQAQYVFVAREGGLFEPRAINRGAGAGDLIEILSGLEPGETVVTTANFLIDSESRLRAAVEGRSP